LDARLTVLLYKKLLLRNPKKVQTGCNLAEPSKEGCGLKMVVLEVIMMLGL
jgi:hypothetical protein